MAAGGVHGVRLVGEGLLWVHDASSSSVAVAGSSERGGTLPAATAPHAV
jgi:hypothetical protein